MLETTATSYCLPDILLPTSPPGSDIWVGTSKISRIGRLILGAGFAVFAITERLCSEERERVKTVEARIGATECASAGCLYMECQVPLPYICKICCALAELQIYLQHTGVLER